MFPGYNFEVNGFIYLKGHIILHESFQQSGY